MWSKIQFSLRFLLAVTTLVIVTGTLAVPIIIVSLFTSSGTLTYTMMRWWAILVSTPMGLKFSLKGAENVQSGQSYIITPNHQGNTDILALLTKLPLRFRWVIKKELLRIPVFGWALGATGAIALDRSNREASIESLKKARHKLLNGWCMLIYPEGTRTPDGKLLPFKKGPFMVAIQTGLPILPVTTNGAFRILPKKKLAFRPGHITVTIAKPIPTEGLTEDDVPMLMEQTRKAIESNLDLDYNPFKD
ncbi:MAG: lysophospholipid acyltransferase family protein [Pseudomonadota bacterium]